MTHISKINATGHSNSFLHGWIIWLEGSCPSTIKRKYLLYSNFQISPRELSVQKGKNPFHNAHNFFSNLIIPGRIEYCILIPTPLPFLIFFKRIWRIAPQSQFLYLVCTHPVTSTSCIHFAVLSLSCTWSVSCSWHFYIVVEDSLHPSL